MRECSLHFPRRRNYWEGRGGGIQARGPSLSFSSLSLSLSFHETITQKFAVIQTHLISFFSFHTRADSCINSSQHKFTHYRTLASGKPPFHTRQCNPTCQRDETATFDREKKSRVIIHKILSVSINTRFVYR